MMIDSQAVKNTCNASIESKGFCFYKATNGIKRHLAVDILGFPFFTHCTTANVSDDQGLIEILSQNIDYFKSKPLDLPKTTILVDHGYHPEKIIPALEQIYPQIMTKIQFELSAKPSKAEKQAKGQSGFVPVPARWVIERSNAWVSTPAQINGRPTTPQICCVPEDNPKWVCHLFQPSFLAGH